MSSIVIADRHPVVLCGLMSLLKKENDFDIVASCRDGMSCLEAIRALTPDIALLEMYVPKLSGLEILDWVNAESRPQTNRPSHRCGWRPGSSSGLLPKGHTAWC